MKYLIAHRGLDNHKYKENSIKGILNSLSKDYVSGIEVDIRFTKDKKIIVYHDLLSDFKIFGKTIFDLFDFVTSNIMLPFNTLIICIVVGWFLNLEKDYLFKNEKVYNVFNFTLKYILPVILVILLVYGLL